MVLCLNSAQTSSFQIRECVSCRLLSQQFRKSTRRYCSKTSFFFKFLSLIREHTVYCSWFSALTYLTSKIQAFQKTTVCPIEPSLTKFCCGLLNDLCWRAFQSLMALDITEITDYLTLQAPGLDWASPSYGRHLESELAERRASSLLSTKWK